MRSFITCTIHRILLGRSIKEEVRWEGHVTHMGGMRNAYKILIGKPEGKRPVRKPRHRQKADNGMNLKGIDW
jgi:hypothetical protein